jgi:hypothetical protein
VFTLATMMIEFLNRMVDLSSVYISNHDDWILEQNGGLKQCLH